MLTTLYMTITLVIVYEREREREREGEREREFTILSILTFEESSVNAFMEAF